MSDIANYSEASMEIDIFSCDKIDECYEITMSFYMNFPNKLFRTNSDV